MADYNLVEVSDLDALENPSNSDVLPIQDGSGLKKITYQNLKTKVVSDEATARANADNLKLNKPTGGNGTSGQMLLTNGDGSTRWASPDDTLATTGEAADAKATGDAIKAVDANLAAPYSTSATYAVGDYCTKDGQLYRCTTAISTAEAWTAAHWSAAALGDDTSTLRSALIHTEEFSIFGKYTLNSSDIVQGAISSTGADGTAANRIRSGYIPITAGASFKFSAGATINETGYYLYNKSKTFISNEVWLGDNETRVFLQDGFVRFMFRNSGNTNIVPSNYDATVSIETAIKNFVDDEKAAFDTFEGGTFTKPTDYGKLIDAADCDTNKPNDLTITDAPGGILVTKTGGVNAVIYVYFNDLPTASAANPVTYDFSITFSDLTGIDEVYFFDGSSEIGRYSGGSGTVTREGTTFKIRYTYKNQTTLNWRFSLLYTFKSTKTITGISGININEPYKIVPNTIKWYLDDLYSPKFDAPNNGIKEIKTFSAMWSQGACAVGDYFVGFNSGADDHSTTGKVNIGLFSDMPNYEQITQNLGHCASADYDENTDTMLVGNGTSDTTIPPCVYLVKGASDVVANKTNIEYNGQNVVAIDLTGLGSGGCVACFGENSDIIYVVTADTETQFFADNNKKFIYRCFMGRGTNNLVSSYPSDSYGTFISGCSANEYNGTLRIMNEYEIAFPGELQGLKYVNGNLLFPTDKNTNSILTSYLVYVKLKSVPVIEKILWIPATGDDGGLVKTECEDVIFHDGVGYVLTNTTVGGSHIYKTHVFRE